MQMGLGSEQHSLGGSEIPGDSPQPSLCFRWLGWMGGQDTSVCATVLPRRLVRSPQPLESQNVRGWKGPLWVI